jgi:hypothetical protein
MDNFFEEGEPRPLFTRGAVPVDGAVSAGRKNKNS